MIRLKQVYHGERAAVILGGPSLVASDFDFRRLRDQGFVTLVEAKALTPFVLRDGFVPDYYLMLFPEKSKDNAFQHFVYRSLLAGYPIGPWLEPSHKAEASAILDRADEYFEPWRPERGPHKRFRWRPDVYLPGSPYELLQQLPQTKIIANRALVDEYFPHFAYSEQAYYFGQTFEEPAFDFDKYYNPFERDDSVFLRCADTFLNSAAIALYPLLRYMGFRDVFFVGMDMSMIGSLEYAAPFTFRSMAHYWWFFRRTMRVFNGNYRANGWQFARPKSEFDDLRLLWADSPVRFTRVYEPWRYATPVEGIRTVPPAEFMRS